MYPAEPLFLILFLINPQTHTDTHIDTQKSNGISNEAAPTSESYTIPDKKPNNEKQPEASRLTEEQPAKMPDMRGKQQSEGVSIQFTVSYYTHTHTHTHTHTI